MIVAVLLVLILVSILVADFFYRAGVRAGRYMAIRKMRRIRDLRRQLMQRWITQQTRRFLTKGQQP
jgi:hypothetical protein